MLAFYPLKIFLDFKTSPTIGEEYWSRWIDAYRSCVELYGCIYKPFFENLIPFLFPIFACIFFWLPFYLWIALAIFIWFLPIWSSTPKWWLRILLLVISWSRIWRILSLLLWRSIIAWRLLYVWRLTRLLLLRECIRRLTLILRLLEKRRKRIGWIEWKTSIRLEIKHDSNSNTRRREKVVFSSECSL